MTLSREVKCEFGAYSPDKLVDPIGISEIALVEVQPFIPMPDPSACAAEHRSVDFQIGIPRQ